MENGYSVEKKISIVVTSLQKSNMLKRRVMNKISHRWQHDMVCSN